MQLRDEVSPLHGAFSGDRKAGTGPLARGLEGVLSPVHGVLSSRQAVSVFRNDELLEQVIRLYDTLAPGFVRTEIFEYPGQASLSWYLTAHERADIHRAACALSAQLDDLAAFWRGERPHAQVGVHIAASDWASGER